MISSEAEARNAPAAIRPPGFFVRLGTMLGKRVLFWLAVSIVASLGLAVVELGLSVFLQLFLKALGLLNAEVQTSGLFGNALMTPTRLALGLCVIALARSATLFLISQSGNIAMETITARLRRVAIWEALLHPSRSFVPAAAVNARVGDLANKSALFSYSAAVCLSSAVQSAALVVIMFLTAWSETMIALAGLGLVGILVLRVNRVVRRVTASVPTELRVLSDGIERVARNMTLVRVLRTEKVEHRRLTTSIDAYAGHTIHAAYLANFSGALPPFAGILLLLVIVWSSQAVVHTPAITLLSFLYLFVRFVQAVASTVQQFSQCNAVWPVFADSFAFVGRFTPAQIELATQAGEKDASRKVERPHSTGGEAPDIEVKDVAFAYPRSTDDVFRNISAQIAKGSQLAIVGPSGCGKSTLLGLILGLFEPQRGEIKIGGRSPADYFGDPAVRVGYVGAESFLIAGTIRENLRYGVAADVGDADLWDALAQAQLKPTIEALPNTLDYTVAEDGSGLSAGQKQRLCLARALLGKPHLLVLDEVSSNLDAETEREIAQSLKSLHGVCTVILVSHREAIFQYADRVVALASLTPE